MSDISHAFVNEKNNTYAKKELAMAYLNKISSLKGSCGIFHFANWLPFESKRDPISTLEVLELLADVIEGKTDRSDLHLRSEDIATAFVQILREADELNDSELLKQVIILQDKFLKIGLDQIEKLYEYN